MSDGILRFSNAEGVTAYNRYNNFLTNYGDFGALQRIGWSLATTTTNAFSFSNIPQNFQDLMLVVYARGDASGSNNAGISVYLNGASTTANYSTTRLLGNGSGAFSGRSTTSVPTFGLTPADVVLPSAGNTSGIFGVATYHILNYANTSTFKTALIRTAGDTNGSGTTTLSAALWGTTAAITSFAVATNGNWVAGSSAALYGVRASAA